MNSKILLLSIAVTGILLISIPTNAETGNITVANTSSYQWDGNINAGSGTVDYTQFLFDTTDYNSVINFTLTDMFPAGNKQWTLAQQSAVTAFTITSGGSGHGVFSYSKYLNHLNWVFSSDTIITSSPFTVTYADPTVITDITNNGAANTGTAVLDITHPMFVRTSAGGALNGFFGGAVTGLRTNVQGSSGIAVNTYNVTYPFPGYFQINVTKTGVATKDTVHTQTTILQTETTFNNNAFTFFGAQTNGIYLNVTLLAGAFNNVLINASGSTVVVPTPTPTPPIVPSNSTTGVALSWDKASYNINEVGTITGNVTTSPPLFGYFKIVITNSTGVQQSFYTWDSSGTFPQVEQFLFSFPAADAYTASFISHSPIFGDTTLVTLSVQAVAPISYIFAPASTVSGSNITIQYKFNPAVSTGGAIEDVVVDSFGFGGVGTYINTSLCPCDTSIHSINYNINGVGKHTLRLWDTTNFTVVASTIVDVTSSGAIVPGNITANYLALDNTNYSVNDVINGMYQISSVNWTSFSYFKASLISSGNINMGSVTLDSQTGTFQLPVSGGFFNVFQGGSANVTIFAGNSVISAGTVMASQPVTILSNKGGFSVSVQPVNICLTQNAIATYTSPTGAGILQVTKMTPAGTTSITNYSFNQNGTQSFVFNPGTVKDQSGIIFSVLDSNAVFQVNTIIKYQSTGCTVPGTNPTPTATIPSSQTTIDSALILLNVLTIVAFYGFVIWLGIIGSTIALMTRGGGSVNGYALIAVAWLSAVFIAVIGLFDPFKIYIIVISTIIAAILLRYLGKETTVEG